MERAAVNRDFDFSNLGINEVIGIIENLLDNLPAQALMRIRDLAETKRLEKLDEAENAVIAEMRQKLEELGVTYDVVVRRKKTVKKDQFCLQNTAGLMESNGAVVVSPRFGCGL